MEKMVYLLLDVSKLNLWKLEVLKRKLDVTKL